MRFVVRCLFVASGVFALSACEPPAADQIFSVNDTADRIDANVGDGLCQDATGQCTLRAAVMEANADPNVTEIRLSGSFYSLSIVGANEDAAASGDLDITESTYIRYVSRIVGVYASGLDRVFEIHGGNYHYFEGLEIVGGSTPDDGGGILQHDSLLVLENTIVRNNTATNGGGIATLGGTLWLEDSTVSENTATGDGGGTYLAANSYFLQATYVDNTPNAIAVDQGGLLRLVASTITDPNEALRLVEGDAAISSSILDAPTGCTVLPQFGSVTSNGYNVASDASCGLAATTDQQGVNPRLAPLRSALNTTVPTRLPYLGSPALDTIALGSGSCVDPVRDDARSASRPVAGACDSGAVEAQDGESVGWDCTLPPNLVPGAQLQNCDLTNRDLSGADLTGADLSNAIIAGAELVGTNFTNVNFTNAQLTDIDFRQTILSGATFTNAQVSSASMAGMNLDGFDLSNMTLHADLSGTSLIGADLSNTHLNAALATGANLTGADLSSSTVYGDMSNAILNNVTADAAVIGAEVTNSSFVNATLEGALIGTSINGTDFSGANLRTSTFQGANGTDTIFVGADLTDATVGETWLIGADFSFATLDGVDLSGSNMTGSTWTNASLTNTNLEGVNLTDANVSGVDLTQTLTSFTSFRGADLTNADFSDKHVILTNFENADLTGADFTNATFSIAQWGNTTCPDGTNSDDNSFTCENNLG